MARQMEKIKNKIKNKKYFMSILAAAVFMTLAYYFPAEMVIGFFVGWLFIIPAAVIIYAINGLRSYNIDKKNSIIVTLKPSDKMVALVQTEKELQELQKEKKLLLKELQSEE